MITCHEFGLRSDSATSAKVQKVGKGLPRQRWPLPRQSYDYTGCGSTYTRAYKASTTLPLFETFADDDEWKRGEMC